MFGLEAGLEPSLFQRHSLKERLMAQEVTAPMVGKVLEVQCKVGDKVQEDDVLLLLEAMKMEIPVVSPVSGVIKEIKVAAGATVDADAVLVVIG
jgi:biotin carboxyl carrier protein